VDRIEIAITPSMFDGFVLDATPTALAVGATAAWAEQRPNLLTLLPDEPPDSQHKLFLPVVRR
jgi:hypothetical protein